MSAAYYLHRLWRKMGLLGCPVAMTWVGYTLGMVWTPGYNVPTPDPSPSDSLGTASGIDTGTGDNEIPTNALGDERWAASPLIDTAANMASNNPVLELGQFGITSDTAVLKLGDGVTTWANLYEADHAGKVLGSVAITAHTAVAYSSIATISGLSGLVVPDLPFPVDVEVYLPACYANTNTSSWVIILYDGVGAAGTGTLHGQDRVSPQNFTNQFAKNVNIVRSLPAHAPDQFRVDALRTAGSGTLGMDVTAEHQAFIRYIGR